MMEKSLVIVCVLFLSLRLSAAAPSRGIRKLTMEDMRDILTEVPQEDRNTFINTEIDIGYRVEIQLEDWEDEEEAMLAREIFNYFVDNQEEIRKRKALLNNGAALSTEICYPDPIGCIDPDDPGIRPLTV